MVDESDLEHSLFPRTGDGEGNTGRLNVDKQPVSVKGGSGPFAAGERSEIGIPEVLAGTGEDLFEDVHFGHGENDLVLGKDKGFSVLQTNETLGVRSTVFTQEGGSVGGDGNVILFYTQKKEKQKKIAPSE